MISIASAAARRSATASNRIVRTAFEVMLLLLLSAVRGFAQTNVDRSLPVTTVSQRILVRSKPGVNLSSLHQNLGVSVLQKFPAIGNLEILKLPAGSSADTLLAAYERSGLVQYAERDHVVHALLNPNDYEFVNGDLWHLKNNGQFGGVVDADIDATDAWDTLTSASNIVVAVLDSGIHTTHQDLAPNLWRNPGEIPGNGVDDDGNGYVDDVFGINTLATNGVPEDDFGHGSHVAGILGAVGNNNVGVAGICWRVQIMACKFLDVHGNGSVSDAVKCIDYARTNGANIINLSWGDPSFASQALYDAIDSARAAGIIVVCACGNSGANNDATPLYPASYNLDNIIAVAATTRSDTLANFSCYGATSVDLGAPGQEVVSCWTGSDNNYTVYSGTSMAAPMVAGACALVWARFRSENYHQIISRILNHVDPLPALAGKCVSGGRLNVWKAITAPENCFIRNIHIIAPGNVALTWSSQPGHNYQVQYKTNLPGGTWQNLSGVITATSTNTVWTNSVGDNERRYFIVKQMN
jgi:subtilisin family serine protease